MPNKPLLLTREIAEEFLGYLADGSPPFIALAADRCGIPRDRVNNWIRDGEAEFCPLRTPFARAVRKIRGAWMAQVSAELMTADKMTSEAARQKAWLLERLDRETFSVPRDQRPPKGEEKPKAVPAPPAVKMTKQVEADLEKPEVDSEPAVH